ncbi:hypothetical protein [Veillonella sp.]|uniref:hypothetical protein n=1 Tax=Veillonella sp. TaxID=1926307 RepID=UPI0025F188E6|nr:hypothetical protein [Veillonella sp.]
MLITKTFLIAYYYLHYKLLLLFLICILLMYYQSFFTVIFYHILTQGGSNAGVPGGVVNVRLPIAYVSSYIIIGGPTGSSNDIYAFLTLVKSDLVNFTAKTYNKNGTLQGYQHDWLTIGV